jgi:hypothetical protein
MPYKQPLGCRQAFAIKNKIAETQANQFLHRFLSCFSRPAFPVLLFPAFPLLFPMPRRAEELTYDACFSGRIASSCRK